MRGRTPYAGKIALAALLAALSLVVLWGAELAPWGRMGLVAVAGLMPAAAVISAGPAAGGLCWGGTSILALLLLWCGALIGADLWAGRRSAPAATAPR